MYAPIPIRAGLGREYSRGQGSGEDEEGVTNFYSNPPRQVNRYPQTHTHMHTCIPAHVHTYTLLGVYTDYLSMCRHKY